MPSTALMYLPSIKKSVTLPFAKSRISPLTLSSPYSATFYYDKDFNAEDKDLYQQMMMAFSTNSPTYHIRLLDKPTLVWNFGSLAIAAQMLLSLSITDDKTPIRLCKHCTKAFIPTRPNALFCSSKCKNQYNVYKSRAK